MGSGWWSRRWARRTGSVASSRSTARGRKSDRKVAPDDVAYIRDFATTRVGVEAFVEPRTAVTDTTVVLVARDGEWTRRRVPSAQAAHILCNDLRIPSYDAAVVGYPARMRDWTARKRQGEV